MKKMNNSYKKVVLIFHWPNQLVKHISTLTKKNVKKTKILLPMI